MLESLQNTSAPAAVDRLSDAVQALGTLLKTTPEMQAFLAASRALHSDATAQNVSRQIRDRQAALQWRRADEKATLETLARLEAQLGVMPVFQAYQQAEQAARDLLREVDAVISGAAGVAFAANAKRSCCGG